MLSVSQRTLHQELSENQWTAELCEKKKMVCTILTNNNRVDRNSGGTNCI